MKTILVLISIYVSFYTYIENILNKLLVNNILSSFKDNLCSRILFIAITIFLFYSIYKGVRSNVKTSTVKFQWALVILLFWYYYRFLSAEWSYVRFFNISHVYYIDMIALWSISIITKKVLYRKRARTIDCSKGLKLDIPITKASEDLLNRDDLAKGLAAQLINTQTDTGSISLGIVSPWGNGKTSFINLLSNHLDQEQNIVIQFNPWIYEKERSLIDAFFLQLSETLKAYNSSLSIELREYAHLLSSSSNTMLSIGAKIIEYFSSQDIQTKYNNINKTIKGIGKLIIVIIDDLDRLDKNEILSVLKLIRNSANFSNIAFITAYDREYLTEALKNNVYKGNVYLDKIFQHEFKLPIYDRSVLKNLLYKEGMKFVKKEDDNAFKKAIYEDYVITIHTGFIFDYIENIRDVLRFINAFHITYDRLRGEVLIKDLMNLELLKMKYPYVYDLLSENHNEYLTIENSYVGNLVLWNEKKKDNNSILKDEKKDIYKSIESKYEDKSLDNEHIKVILNSLFKDGYSKPNIKAINNSDYINRYFYYSLLNSDISEDEFNSVMEESYDSIKNSIDNWVVNQSRSLTILLANFNISNADKYKKTIKSIFYFGKISKYWTLDEPKIVTIINNSPINDKKENAEFIRSVFSENGTSEYVVKFIHDVFYNNASGWNFIISEDDCKEVCYKMFEEVCKKNEPIETIYNFLKYTKYITRTNNNGNITTEYSHSQKADDLFLEYTRFHPSKVLPTFISRSLFKSAHTACIENWVYEIWGSKDNFIDFITNLPKEDELISEFCDFMKIYMKEEKPIKYHFKYMSKD